VRVSKYCKAIEASSIQGEMAKQAVS